MAVSKNSRSRNPSQSTNFQISRVSYNYSRAVLNLFLIQVNNDEDDVASKVISIV